MVPELVQNGARVGSKIDENWVFGDGCGVVGVGTNHRAWAVVLNVVGEDLSDNCIQEG